MDNEWFLTNLLSQKGGIKAKNWIVLNECKKMHYKNQLKMIQNTILAHVFMFYKLINLDPSNKKKKKDSL